MQSSTKCAGTGGAFLLPRRFPLFLHSFLKSTLFFDSTHTLVQTFKGRGGLSASSEEALKWWLLAARQGHAAAASEVAAAQQPPPRT